MPEWLWAAVAWAEAAALLVYLVLFLVRKDVSLRPRTIGLILLLGGLAQLLLLILEWASQPSGFVVVGLAGHLGAAVAFLWMSGPRLVHASLDAVRAEVEEASRRLFIHKEEPRPGEVRLTAKGATVVLSLIPAGRAFTLVLLPGAGGVTKLSLFLDFMAKRYPGPLPRVRVDLSRR